MAIVTVHLVVGGILGSDNTTTFRSVSELLHKLGEAGAHGHQMTGERC